MIIGLYHPVLGGAEKVCQKLSKSLHERGMEVSVLTQRQNGLPDFEVIDGVPVHRRMRWWHPFGIAYMLSVLLFLVRHRRRYDTIQCFGLFLFIPPALLMKYLFKKKALLRLLCSGPYGDFANMEGLKFNRLISACARRFDRIIYLSVDMKKELLEHGIPEEKLVRISNGVAADLYMPAAAPATHVCYVGRLETQKGIDHLLRAFSIIRHEDLAAQLFVVGGGTQKDRLEDLAKSLGIEGQVTFAGCSEDVRDYYQNARIFVMPSLAEGMSSALLEAMSCGLAVITTRSGAGEELIGAELPEQGLPQGSVHIGRRGILVNSGDENGLAASLRLLLNDERLCKDLGDRARKYVLQSCSYETMVSTYRDLYRSLG